MAQESTVRIGYEKERPRYKRKPRGMSSTDFRTLGNAECDELIRRVARLKEADPPLDLRTHPETRRLVTEKSPSTQKDYKHREDLLDAALCAWTAALWSRWGADGSRDHEDGARKAPRGTTRV